MRATGNTVVWWWHLSELRLRPRPFVFCGFALMVGWVIADVTAHEGPKRSTEIGSRPAAVLVHTAPHPASIECNGG